MPGEQGILPVERDRTDGSLDGVVIDFNPTIGNVRPMLPCFGDGRYGAMLLGREIRTGSGPLANFFGPIELADQGHARFSDRKKGTLPSEECGTICGTGNLGSQKYDSKSDAYIPTLAESSGRSSNLEPCAQVARSAVA